MAEKSLGVQFDELKGHHEGVMVSLTTLQNKLDAALQKEVDDRAAHAAVVQLIQGEHAAEIAKLQDEHAAALASLREQLAKPTSWQVVAV